MHILFEESASCMTIDLETMKVENWLFDSPVDTHYKTADRCLIKFETKEGKLFSYEGYVPDFFPGEHYGDYVTLHISKTGAVRGLKVSDEAIDEVLKEYKNWLKSIR
mgnify:FL=1